MSGFYFSSISGAIQQMAGGGFPAGLLNFWTVDNVIIVDSKIKVIVDQVGGQDLIQNTDFYRATLNATAGPAGGAQCIGQRQMLVIVPHM